MISQASGGQISSVKPPSQSIASRQTWRLASDRSDACRPNHNAQQTRNIEASVDAHKRLASEISAKNRSTPRTTPPRGLPASRRKPGSRRMAAYSASAAAISSRLARTRTDMNPSSPTGVTVARTQ